MLQVKEQNPYLADFERFERETAGDPAWLVRLRKSAIARFAELGFPGPRNEDWKFTSVAPLTKLRFERGLAYEGEVLSADRLEEHLFPGCIRLAFVNGRFTAGLSSVSGLPKGIIVESLADALEKHLELVEPHLGRYAKHSDLAFTALNTAFLQDGAFVHIPKGVMVERPIHLLFVTAADEPTVAYPRNLIVAEANTQVALVESYISLAQGVALTNAVSEIVASEGAVIDHYKVQRESAKAFHFANTQVVQRRGSNFSTHYIGLGGELVRNEVRVLLDAEGCEATVNGLYLAGGKQHIDNHTVIDHAKPHCASHELYKGILDGQARGVFNGKIFVRQDAQKTDAKQTNQTLLLSDDAVINTKPQLEIFADDVKCTHGATVGQLEENQLFYLRSRGLGEEQARNLLIYAFANDIVGRIKVAPVRAQLEEILLARSHLPRVEEAV